MNCEIRAFQEQDVLSITKIVNYSIENETAIYDYHPRTEELQLQILDEKIKKGFPVIVATVDEKIVGFGYYSEFRFRDAYRFTVEHSVYVDHEFHRNGIGKQLLTRLIELAKLQKLHTMIGVIDAENSSSIDFHKRNGFEIVGRIKESGFKFNRWLHSVIMQIMLE
jgi:L-amino acid N-acyltransferase